MQKFIDGFLNVIIGKLSNEDYDFVKKELSIYVNDYDISEKCTEIKIKDDYFPTFYQDYFVSKKVSGLSPKTLCLYKMYLDNFFITISMPIKNITTNDILVYLYQTQKIRKLSDRTLDNRRAVINGFFEWAVDEHHIQNNPCKTIKPIKYCKKRRVPLTDFELKKIRNACSSIRESALIEFLYSTGCRVSELESMNICDVNFDSGEVIVRNGKGKKERKTYLTEKVKDLLVEYLNSRKDNNEALFVSMRNPYNRLLKPAIEYLIKAISKKAGLTRHVFPHLFRNTLATNMLKHGGDITSIQTILGHSNIQTTLIYARQDDRKVKKDHARCIA